MLLRTKDLTLYSAVAGLQAVQYCSGQRTLRYIVVTNGISFHARVGRFSPFLYSRSVTPPIPMESGHSSDFVLASPCSPRLPVFLVSPYFS